MRRRTKTTPALGNDESTSSEDTISKDDLKKEVDDLKLSKAKQVQIPHMLGIQDLVLKVMLRILGPYSPRDDFCFHLAYPVRSLGAFQS